MVQAATQYGLRARALDVKWSKRKVYNAEDLAQPAAHATVAAGLRPGSLTKAERLHFGAHSAEYLDARNSILQLWESQLQMYLSANDCAASVEDKSKHAMLKEAWQFLHDEGHINQGILEGEPESKNAGVAKEEPYPPTDLLLEKLQQVLEKADMETVTMKKIRQQLNAVFKVDLSDRKDFLAAQVDNWLNQRPFQSPAESAPQAQGPVIVIGAGPAGLAAAHHLKRCGVDVVVLEARNRVGGRVHTMTGQGFSTGIDLGASIITGVAANTDRGLRADPSALLAKQVGAELHQLTPALPLFDGVTGQAVAQATDSRVERLRDVLMDDARERVDNLGEALVAGESLGEALDRAFAERIKLPQGDTMHAGAPIQDTRAAPLPLPYSPEEKPNTAEPEGGVAGPTETSAAGIAEAGHAETNPVDASASAMADHTGGPTGRPTVQSIDGEPGDMQQQQQTGPTANLPQGGVTDTSSQQPDRAPADDAPEGPTANKTDANKHEEGHGVATAADPVANFSFVGENQPAPGTASGDADVAPAEQAVTAKAEPGDPVGVPGTSGLATDEVVDVPTHLTDEERRLLDWHWANLEYGCSARLNQVSLANWNQDEAWGGFGGPHCMVKGGYSGLMEPLAASLQIKHDVVVSQVAYNSDGVTVTAASGKKYQGVAVIVTVPLGCLKTGDIAFKPSLPAWKQDAIEKLGFGNLNKVVLEFPSAFWTDEYDYFGAAVDGGPELRGRCFMYWNCHRFCGAPILAAIISGGAASSMEEKSDEEVQEAALLVLRNIYGKAVQQPVACAVTRWAQDPYSKGSYSFVGLHASSKTYDDLAKPVQRRVLFAGEHTCKEHPDTVGGAMLTGVREAVRVLRMLKGDTEEEANAAAGAVDAGLPSRKRKQADGGSLADTHAGSGDDSGGGGGGPPRKRSAKSKPRKSRMHTEGSAADGDHDMPEARPMRSAAEVQKELEAREEARSRVKLIWRALSAMVSGEPQELVELMQHSTSAEQRMQLLECLQRDTAGTRAKLAGDPSCLGALEEWVLDLLEDKLAFHVLETLLKVLLTLPVHWDALKDSGLAHTVFKGLPSHPIRGVKALAETLCKRWHDAAPKNKHQPKAHKESVVELLGNPASVNPKLEDVPRPVEESSGGYAATIMDQRQTKTEPDEPQKPELDPAVQARIEEAERIAAQAEAEAAAYAEHAANIQAEHDSLQLQHQQAANGKVQSFSKFQAELRAKQAQKYSKRHRQRHSSKDKQTQPKPDRPAQPAPAADNTQVKEVTASYAAEVLKPRFNNREVSKEDYKWVLRKTVEKVAAATSSTSAGADFLNEKRKAKIKSLVDHYVSQRKHEQSAAAK